MEKRLGHEIRKEKVPAEPKCHLELDDSRLLDKDQITECQRLIEILQWIQSSLRMDVSFSTCSLSRFQSQPQEGHFKQALKVFRHLKQCPKRGAAIDGDDSKHDFAHEKLTNDFRNQHCI